MQPKFGSLSSSVNPQELATTVQGIIKVIAGVLVSLGILTAVDGNSLIEQVAIIVSSGFTIYGAAETVFGIVRKIIVRFVA